METLKRILVLALILNAMVLHSQEFEKTKAAFSQSYINEYNKKYSEAVQNIESVYSDQNYEMNLRLGYLQYLNAQYVKSCQYYEKAISLRPMSIEARLGYALPASSLGNWDKIKIKYEEILKLDENNSVVNYRMGLILYYEGNYEKAKTFFEKVVNFYPFDYDSLLMLGWCNLKIGKTSDAKLLFQKVLLYNPSDSSAMSGMLYVR